MKMEEYEYINGNIVSMPKEERDKREEEARKKRKEEKRREKKNRREKKKRREKKRKKKRELYSSRFFGRRNLSVFWGGRDSNLFF